MAKYKHGFPTEDNAFTHKSMLSECNQQISARLNFLPIDIQIARFIQCFNSHGR